MSIVDPNPYAPPGAASNDKTPRPALRRLVPATIFFLLGTASFVLGVFAVALMNYVVFKRKMGETPVSMIAGCLLYLGVGLSWMLAGWFYWGGRYRSGLVATLIGVVIPIVLFSIMGF